MYSFTGRLSAYGGDSSNEHGGPGTIYVSKPQLNDNSTERFVTLLIDNKGHKPLSQYISGQNDDSSRAQVILQSDKENANIHFDEVVISGSGHLVFKSNQGSDFSVNVENLSGDKSGFLHITKGIPVKIRNSASPIPVAFRIYDMARLVLPPGRVDFITSIILN